MSSPPPRRDRPTLAERSAASGLGTAGATGEGRDSRLPRHCWIRDEGGWRPGLLLAWRRCEDGGWQGRVACALDSGHGQDDALVVAWMAAEQLRPMTL